VAEEDVIQVEGIAIEGTAIVLGDVDRVERELGRQPPHELHEGVSEDVVVELDEHEEAVVRGVISFEFESAHSEALYLEHGSDAFQCYAGQLLPCRCMV
jgi:hypothetical protein